MANLKLFSILDVKANAFIAPFAAPTTGIAARMFTDTVNDSKSLMHKHPRDFRLACIGTFNENSAAIDSTEPEWLGFATEFIEHDPRQIDITEAINTRKLENA